LLHFQLNTRLVLVIVIVVVVVVVVVCCQSAPEQALPPSALWALGMSPQEEVVRRALSAQGLDK
jgi:hypothetical protein